MHVFVTIQHPAHVHFFRPTIEELESAGHEVTVFAREKDLAVGLLRAYGIPHRVLAGGADSLAKLTTAQLRYEYELYRAVRRRDPDVIAGVGGYAAAHVGRLTHTPSVFFTDTELASNWLAVPFADLLVTPRGFEQSFGRGHVRYDGFQELAYLHPDRFERRPETLRAHGVEPDDPYSVVRFGSMAATHDVGRTGFSRREARDLVARLEEFGPVYVSVEGTDAAGFPGQPFPVPSAEAHQLLAAADVVATDACTMGAEAGLLGRPAVRLRPEGEDLSNFRTFESAGLVRSVDSAENAIDEVSRLAADPNATDRWARRRDSLLRDCVDVTSVVCRVIETVGGGRDPVTVTGVESRV